MREWLSGRASPCQGEGRGFDSRLTLLSGCGSVWLERLIWVQEAAGSSPVTPIKLKSSNYHLFDIRAFFYVN